MFHRGKEKLILLIEAKIIVFHQFIDCLDLVNVLVLGIHFNLINLKGSYMSRLDRFFALKWVDL